MSEMGKTRASPLEMTSSYAEVICFGKVGGQLLRLAHFSGWIVQKQKKIKAKINYENKIQWLTLSLYLMMLPLILECFRSV